jgi:hemolysin activation/secretion protein
VGRNYLAIASLTFSLLAVPCYGQVALDRVDPGRTEERVTNEREEIPTTNDPQILESSTAFQTQDDVFVGAIAIDGLHVMARGDFSDIVENYIGRTLSGSELTELVERLANRVKAKFPLASVYVEPQKITAGVLQVTIDEGAIDEVRIEGAQNRSVVAALSKLASGQPVTAVDLERSLLVAGDIDGVTLGNVRVMREENRNVLVVNGTYERVGGSVTFGNDGSKPLGPLELYGHVRFNGLFAQDDTLQVFILDTVPEVEELVFGQVRYGKRVSREGTEISATGSFSRSAPGAYLEPFNIRGESWTVSLGLLHPALRRQNSSIWIRADASHRQIKQSRDGALARQDRLTTVSAGIYGYSRLAGGWLRANAQIKQGLDLFDATQLGDPLSSRQDADGTFTTATFDIGWRKNVVADLGINVAVRSQLALQPLLISEETGLGGANFVRGYDYSERTGDQALLAYGELNYSWDSLPGPLAELEFYGFVDGGKAYNLDEGFGGGSLFSSGGGFRADIGKSLTGGLEVAVPLSGVRYDTGDSSARVRFQVTQAF